MGIANSAVLVEMNISVWTANKLDKESTDKVITDNSASKDSAKVHKNLMAGSSLRKDIADYSAGCRLWHNQRTLSWSDKGARLLPTSAFLEYKNEVNVRRDNFNRMVDKFILEYPNLVATAQNYLGNLFKAEDYPSAEEVRSKFGFRLVFSPIPESGDFRLDIAREDLDAMRAQYDQDFDTRIAEAMREPWDKLHKCLTHISEKLVEPEVGQTKRYHESLVSNAQGLCQLLTHLNITKDPKLEEARRELELTMLGIDVDDIKEHEEIRTHVKSKVDEILKKFEW